MKQTKLFEKGSFQMFSSVWAAELRSRPLVAYIKLGEAQKKKIF